MILKNVEIARVSITFCMLDLKQLSQGGVYSLFT